MALGFNTNVCGKDATYHVQTEDRGLKNPVIDSVIYVGGRIVDQVRTCYVPEQQTEAEIEAIVRNQHRELVESIRSGAFVPSVKFQEPTSASGDSGYTVKLTNCGDVCRDGRLNFEFAVQNRGQGTPVQGACLHVRWMPAGEEAQKVEMWTGNDGKVVVSFPVPEGCSETALLVLVKGNEGRELLKFAVRAASAVSLSYSQEGQRDRPGI